MQDIKTLFRLAEKFATDNSPALLTGVGVVGTISTAILSARAHVAATDRIRASELNVLRDEETRVQVFKRRAKLTWKLYIPPVSVAALSCTATIYANRIGTRRAAALAVAYATSDKAYNEYKDKVTEMLGEKEEAKVREEIAKDKVTKNPPSSELIVDGEDRTLFYDAKCGRYFLSTMETVKAAENHCNYLLRKEGDVSLNTFYSWLGLNTVQDGEELGWRFDKGEISIMYTATIADNNKPAIVMDFRTTPIRYA